MNTAVDFKAMLGALPSGRLEQYRNTPVGKLFAGVDALCVPFDGDEPCSPELSPCAQCGLTIKINNGLTDGLLLGLPSGVMYGSLAKAKIKFPELVEKYLDTQAAASGDHYSNLCREMASDGAFVFVPSGLEIVEPITIISNYKGEKSQASFERHLIIIEDGAKANVVFEKKLKSVGEGPLGSDITETFVGKDATLEVANICDMPSGNSISNSYTKQQEASNYKSVDMGVAVGLLRFNRNVSLDGEGAHCGMFGLFVSGPNELFDYHTVINHNAANCTSDEHFKDLIAVGGVGVFRGRIYVAKGAQKTEAMQQNNNILLGNGAKIFTKPELEIYADDVKCNHGATIGRPDDDAIYYMRQRGIGEDMARRLLVMGFVNDIISRCKISCVADKIVSDITRKIENL